MRHRHRSLTPRFLAASVFGLAMLAALDVALADPPNGPPDGPGCHGPGHAPPAEAFTACANQSAGAACTVQHDGHTMQGTCGQAHDDTRLVCRPPHGHRGPPEAAYTACANQSSGTACSVNIHGQQMSGTCAQHPNDARLHCRPAGMPPGPPPAQ